MSVPSFDPSVLPQLQNPKDSPHFYEGKWRLEAIGGPISVLLVELRGKGLYNILNNSNSPRNERVRGQLDGNGRLRVF